MEKLFNQYIECARKTNIVKNNVKTELEWRLTEVLDYVVISIHFNPNETSLNVCLNLEEMNLTTTQIKRIDEIMGSEGYISFEDSTIDYYIK